METETCVPNSHTEMLNVYRKTFALNAVYTKWKLTRKMPAKYRV